MNVNEEIRAAIKGFVAVAKKVRISCSKDGGITTTTLSGAEAVKRIEELVEKAEISRIKIMSSKKEIASFPFIGGTVAAAAVAIFALPLALLGMAALILGECDVEIEAKEKQR
ncbi:MAG: DUF4342 domain-containing protein [bacterium]|nr:DUF4342 domain-containing protein [bacterium]